MDNEIPEINELIQQFSKLPGLGPKSAKRIILKLINNKDNMVKPLAKSLAEVYKKVVRCVDCGNLKIIDKVCICSSDNSYDKICVVENLADMWVIDSANIYKGHYIEDTIKNDKLKITKLAQGLPVGGEIEQLDDGTLFSAFKNRVPVTGN